jgi:hypothetical protein
MFLRFLLQVFVELRLKLLEGLHTVEVSLFVCPFKSIFKILSLNPSL